MKESKEQQCHQQSQEEGDAIYAQMLQNFEKTRAAVRTPFIRPLLFLMKSIGWP